MHWDTLDYLLGHTRGVEGGESANQIVNFYIMSGIVQPLLIHFHMTDLYNITYYRYSCMHRCGWPDHIGLFCILCSSFLSFHIMGPFYLILYCQIGQKGPFFLNIFYCMVALHPYICHLIVLLESLCRLFIESNFLDQPYWGRENLKTKIMLLSLHVEKACRQ